MSLPSKIPAGTVPDIVNPTIFEHSESSSNPWLTVAVMGMRGLTVEAVRDPVVGTGSSPKLHGHASFSVPSGGSYLALNAWLRPMLRVRSSPMSVDFGGLCRSG